MIYSKILSTGSYLPQQVMTNHDFAERMDTSDEWIRTRTGIEQRHIAAANESSTDLAYYAARDSLQVANIDPASIDLIIVATSTPEHLFPSNASQLQMRLGCGNIPAFDMQAACSGFVFALATADNFIRTGSSKRALVIGAEVTAAPPFCSVTAPVLSSLKPQIPLVFMAPYCTVMDATKICCWCRVAAVPRQTALLIVCLSSIWKGAKSSKLPCARYPGW